MKTKTQIETFYKCLIVELESFEVSYWAIYWKEISQIWLLYYIIIYKELEMLRTL